MSANGETGSAQEDNVCRDFLRNVCNRGKRCRFRHPEPGEAAELAKKVEYVFCHDFQNKECLRTNCKFLHCTKQEEEHYRFSGELPAGVLERLASVKNDATINKAEIPVCKDYLKGDCRRGNRCRFRHMNSSEYEVQMSMNSTLAERKRERFDQYDRYSFTDFEPEPKRHLYDEHYQSFGIEHQVLGPSYRMLEEENNMLRRKVNELKKQVSDMTATNEFLLDQNAQLRLSKQTTTVSPVVSQTLIPHTIPPSVAPIPSGITQIPINNSDLSVAAAQTTLQPQRIASELAAAAAASQTMAQIPVTLGQGPVSIASAALSINQAIPAVSLAQSIHQMSGPTTSLVSYPIMTRSMRPIIPQSLGQ